MYVDCGEEKRGKKENPEMKSTGDNGKEFSSDDEASPRGILEAPVSGTESDLSGSSDFSSFSSEKSAEAVVTEEKEVAREVSVPAWKSMIDVFKFKTVRRLTAIPLLVANHDVSKKGLSKKLARIRSAEDSIDIGAIPTKPSWRNFEYAELVAATNDFSSGFILTSVFLTMFSKISVRLVSMQVYYSVGVAAKIII